MRSDRVARVLLRLYPRAWRERYGEEFVALVADTGLTTRTIMDVVVSAAVERLREARTSAATEVVVMLGKPLVLAIVAWELARVLAATGMNAADDGLWLSVVASFATGRSFYGVLHVRDDAWAGIGAKELCAWTVALLIGAVKAAWPGPYQPDFWQIVLRLSSATLLLHAYAPIVLARSRRQLQKRAATAAIRLNLNQ